MVWVALPTSKLWLTGVAAAQFELPGCVAWMVHIPTPTSVTVFPATLQTAVAVEVKLTAKPELAVALTRNTGCPYLLFANAPKVMVWLSCVTWKLSLIG